MPEITQDTPVKEIQIQGLFFEAPLPYEEGHELTAGEASALNQTYHENVRNNFAGTIKKATTVENGEDRAVSDLDENEKGQLKSQFAAVCDAYEFGAGRSGGRTGDPVKAQAIDLATAEVKRALKAKGYTISKVEPEKIRSLAEAAVKEHAVFMEKATAIVDLRKQAASAVSASVSIE